MILQILAEVICDVILLVSFSFSYKTREDEDFYASILGRLSMTIYILIYNLYDLYTIMHHPKNNTYELL